jgi:hypothetical protein
LVEEILIAFATHQHLNAVEAGVKKHQDVGAGGDHGRKTHDEAKVDIA